MRSASTSGALASPTMKSMVTFWKFKAIRRTTMLSAPSSQNLKPRPPEPTCRSPEPTCPSIAGAPYQERASRPPGFLERHVATVRDNIESKKAELDSNRAVRNAENAEDDAAFAIDYAASAIDEAEYAVLDAVVARKQADELTASA